MSYKERLHIDDLDGAVTLFKSTEDGTETIAVFDEEHREVVEDLVKEINRFRTWWDKCKQSQSIVYRTQLMEEYISSMDDGGTDYHNWLKEIGEEHTWRREE